MSHIDVGKEYMSWKIYPRIFDDIFPNWTYASDHWLLTPVYTSKETLFEWVIKKLSIVFIQTPNIPAVWRNYLLKKAAAAQNILNSHGKNKQTNKQK